MLGGWPHMRMHSPAAGGGLSAPTLRLAFCTLFTLFTSMRSSSCFRILLILGCSGGTWRGGGSERYLPSKCRQEPQALQPTHRTILHPPSRRHNSCNQQPASSPAAGLFAASCRASRCLRRHERHGGGAGMERCRQKRRSLAPQAAKWLLPCACRMQCCAMTRACKPQPRRPAPPTHPCCRRLGCTGKPACPPHSGA